MLSFAIIIPARFASARFPGKPLVQLTGASGVRKSLINRTWECAKSVVGSAGVWIATDDERIATEVKRFGGQVLMTSSDCANGTERCAEAVSQLGDVAEVVVNLQGDAPLTPQFIISELVKRLSEDSTIGMATPAVRCSRAIYDRLLEDRAQGLAGATTVVFNRRHNALYFSKEVLPWLPAGKKSETAVPVRLHLGLYAYTPSALRTYRSAGTSELEVLEGLEQLRFLDIELPVSIVETEPFGWDPVELNNPGDVKAVEQILLERGIE